MFKIERKLDETVLQKITSGMVVFSVKENPRKPLCFILGIVEPTGRVLFETTAQLGDEYNTTAKLASQMASAVLRTYMNDQNAWYISWNEKGYQRSRKALQENFERIIEYQC